MNHSPHRLGRQQRQSGISLITVLVLLLLSLMAVMGAFRVANLNEALLGNSTDYSRTYAAAEALLNDAELDIRGRRPPFTTIQADGIYGFPCRSDTAGSNTTKTGYVGCRNLAGGDPWFPEGGSDFENVDLIVAANTDTYFAATRRCLKGICIPLNSTDLANIENNLTAMASLGATYGQYTRANTYDTSPGVSGNPILIANPARAWYWVEVFRYQKAVCGTIGACGATPNEPDGLRPYVFRITAVAQGLKVDASGNPTTRVVLKSVFVPSIDPK